MRYSLLLFIIPLVLANCGTKDVEKAIILGEYNENCYSILFESNPIILKNEDYFPNEYNISLSESSVDFIEIEKEKRVSYTSNRYTYKTFLRLYGGLEAILDEDYEIKLFDEGDIIDERENISLRDYYTLSITSTREYTSSIVIEGRAGKYFEKKYICFKRQNEDWIDKYAWLLLSNDTFTTTIYGYGFQK
jgi:hypothetical protein